MQPKITTGHNRTQYPPLLEERFAIITSCGPDVGVELPPISTKDCEEAIGLLRQAYPSVRLICVYAEATVDLPALQQQADRHRDIIVNCRGADYPASVYAERLGLPMVFGEVAPQNQPSPVRGAEASQ
ncbi:hypothetical protein [Pseudomonas putida]|uniref:hypothetical protein n=1 Tax=Pseudomonas putida TaxID=303 RepID=UPI00168B1BC5|nr:hypothetical protein [Pseudomonas putida]MBI6961322.1 hypothetical protein [Pseudomonas putida]QNL89314.1 Uncharacterized protein PPKH_3900 [Pseudomonas putida]